MNNYFYIDANGQECGPIPAENLKNEGITKDTKVKCEGAETWEKAGEVSELSAIFMDASAASSETKSKVKTAVLPEECPNSQWVWSILAMIFCCLPFGAVSLFKATQVGKLWKAGRKDEALSNVKSSRRWFWGGFISWLVTIIVMVSVTIFTTIIIPLVGTLLAALGSMFAALIPVLTAIISALAVIIPSVAPLLLYLE